MRRRTLIGALLALALVGCSAPAGASSEAVSADLDRLGREVWRVTEDETAECMRASGFEYSQREYEPASSLVLGSLTPFLLTPEQAASRGFGIVDGQLRSVALAPVGGAGEGSAADSARERALLGDGSPGSGCRELAAAKANQGVSHDRYPVLLQRSELAQRIAESPAYAGFWRSWSRCMADVGIEAQDADLLEAGFVDRAARLVERKAPNGGEVGAEFEQLTVDEAAAEALRAEEVAAAEASVACLEPVRAEWTRIVDEARP